VVTETISGALSGRYEPAALMPRRTSSPAAARLSHGTRRSNRYTFSPAGWITTNSSRRGGAELVAIGVPDDFVAFRVGFVNIRPTPFNITKVIACASSRWNDYINPLDEAQVNRPSSAWSASTFAMKGADDPRIVTAHGAPTSATVAGNTIDPSSGETNVPAMYWSDWTPCRSVGADPAFGMRVLMLRCQIPPGQPLTTTHNYYVGWNGVASVHLGYDAFLGGFNNGSDQVTDPADTQTAGLTAAVLKTNCVASGQTMAVIEVLTERPGYLILTGGDSHHMGSSTVSEINSYLPQAVLPIGAANVGRVPFGIMNVAQGGMTSRQFFPRLANAIAAAQPSVVILPGWTSNDLSGSVRADAAANTMFLTRLIATAEVARKVGTIPIFLTPFPRDPANMTEIQVGPWLALRQAILGMEAAGEIVADATAVLGQRRSGVFDGTFIPNLTSDHVHPNDAGHAAVAALLMPILRAVCGLG
jgi:hypothetical protein